MGARGILRCRLTRRRIRYPTQPETYKSGAANDAEVGASRLASEMLPA